MCSSSKSMRFLAVAFKKSYIPVSFSPKLPEIQKILQITQSRNRRELWLGKPKQGFVNKPDGDNTYASHFPLAIFSGV